MDLLYSLKSILEVATQVGAVVAQPPPPSQHVVVVVAEQPKCAERTDLGTWQQATWRSAFGLVSVWTAL